MAELKRIDFNKGVFEANGKTYSIEGQMSIERYCEYQILEKELSYATTFKGMYDKLVRLKDLMNKLRFVDAAVELSDLLRGVSKIEEREPTVLKMCALFMNTEDEDRTVFTQDLYVKKIADWKQEGIDMRDFFQAASNMVAGFLDVYRTVTRITSGQQNTTAEANQPQEKASQ